MGLVVHADHRHEAKPCVPHTTQEAVEPCLVEWRRQQPRGTRVRRREGLAAQVPAPAIADLDIEGDLVAVHGCIVGRPDAANASRTGGATSQFATLPMDGAGRGPVCRCSDQPELLAAHDGAGATGDPELGQDVGDVPLHRPGRHAQRIGDLRVAGAGGEEAQDVELA